MSDIFNSVMDTLQKFSNDAVKAEADNFENLQLLCGACNSLKGTRTMAEAIAAYNNQ